jgi:hypothetical protein
LSNTFNIEKRNLHTVNLTGIRGVSSVDITRNNATSMWTRMAFREAIHAHATTTRRWMDDVFFIVFMVVYFKSRNEKPERLPNLSKVIIPRENCRLLLTATFAGATTNSEWAINLKQFCFGL